MYPIHSSKKRYEKEYSYPDGVEIEDVPYNGNPFSAYTILRKGQLTLYIQFGVGGYYPDIAFEYIQEFFK